MDIYARLRVIERCAIGGVAVAAVTRIEEIVEQTTERYGRNRLVHRFGRIRSHPTADGQGVIELEIGESVRLQFGRLVIIKILRRDKISRENTLKTSNMKVKHIDRRPIGRERDGIP